MVTNGVMGQTPHAILPMRSWPAAGSPIITNPTPDDLSPLRKCMSFAYFFPVHYISCHSLLLSLPANMFRIYEVDPDADVLLIVPPSTTPFAQWDAGENSTSAFSGTRSTGVPLAPTAASAAELRIKVSSKHLSLASRNFRDQFKWKWPSTKNSQPDGRFHLRLENFDAKAVTIVMDALHGRGSRVPRSVDLETLAKIAMFVDEFQCYEAVEVYAERWIGQLEKSLPSRYNRDAVLWIHIAYVFHRPDLFKAVTRLVILQSTDRLSDLGLPLREKISSKLRTS